MLHKKPASEDKNQPGSACPAGSSPAIDPTQDQACVILYRSVFASITLTLDTLAAQNRVQAEEERLSIDNVLEWPGLEPLPGRAGDHADAHPGLLKTALAKGQWIGTTAEGVRDRSDQQSEPVPANFASCVDFGRCL